MWSMGYTHEHMKLLYIESDACFIKDHIVYLEWLQLSLSSIPSGIHAISARSTECWIQCSINIKWWK